MAATICLPSFPLSKTFPPSSKISVKPLAILSPTGYKMGVQYELKQGQNRQFHELSSGLKMEVISMKKQRRKEDEEERESPPLVFVHGSFHGAWCWAEHWLPFFSHHGFDCFALSLLAQGESDAPADKVAGTLQTHAADVAHFIKKELTPPAVLVGHSFGDMSNQHPDLAGAVLVCSVPPSGNSGLVWRYLFSKPIAAFKVTRSLAAKAFQTDLSLCKETFFSTQMDDNLVQRYQMLMKESSRLPLFDLRKLNASLPVPSVPESSVKVLVVGARDDFIVDAKGLDETGKFYGVSPICVDGVAHDMMLDCSWEKGANVILSWLRTIDS
uniref:AB hydrolase-1 domain-containing protein n=1 Tax=Chenopodium quinoa TaxID=63459 RepID=A0A803M4C7_CHEQI